MAYRPDIDALRAIAVLSVVLYHANAAWLPGGFVGVDIFFVISGFLITGIIHGELQRGSFSLARFYMRRARRILPAFFVVVFATLAFGWFVMLPFDFFTLANSAFSSLVFLSNIFFMRMDYFATAAEQSPLLHTWSLAVEEQFYLAWPLALMLLARLRRPRLLLAATFAIAALSFALSGFMASSEWLAPYSFYLPVTRAGELLAGALIALLPAQRLAGWPAALAGLLLVGLSVFMIDDASVFPGFLSLLPCAGAALLIIGGMKANAVSRALSVRPLVFTGLVSYSLYLWHWPIFAYLRYILDTTALPVSLLAAAIALAFLLSVATWRFVEQPARRRRHGTLAPVLARYHFAPSAAVLALFIVSFQTTGIPARFGPNAHDYFFSGNNDGCHDSRAAAGEGCAIGADGMAPARVLLVGDSHASQMAVLLDELGAINGFSIEARHVGACLPLLGVESRQQNFRRSERCNRLRAFVAANLADYDTLILAARWDGLFRNPDLPAELRRTLETLAAKGKEVIVLAQVPSYAHSYARMRIASGGLVDPAVIEDDAFRTANARLRALVADFHNVRFLDLTERVSDSFRWAPVHNGHPLYVDRHHLSIWGARVVAREVGDMGLRPK